MINFFFLVLLSGTAASPLLLALPAWYVYGFTFLVGATVGSFLNVCILRIPAEGVSIFYPRHSRCPVCETSIAWYDNIPILSWLLLRGKCRSCKTSISLQYPLIELLTAVMALAVVKRFGLQPVTLVWFALICALIVITFIDIAWWIIPDVISLPGIPLGIALAYLLGDPMPSWQSSVAGAVIGGGVFLLISQGYVLLTGRHGMGMGDAKLLGMIGAFLGWKALPFVILLASAQGLLAALLLYTLGWRQGVPQEFLEPEPTQPEQIEPLPESTEQPHGSHRPEPAEHLSEPREHHAVPTETLPAEPPSAGQPSQEVGFRQVAIPFGPFLSLAAIEFLFWGENIMLTLAHYLRFSL